MMAQTFPASLKEFGYDFDADGRLRQLDAATGFMTENRFEYNISEDAGYNQKRYEALGEVINIYVYDLLEREGLKRLLLPKESASPVVQRSFIFASDDALVNRKLIILVHGSGVVRAGQWARRLIINDSLLTGTQIPYVRKAKELDYGLLVLNTNDNYRTIGENSYKIEGSGDPHEHFDTVWKDYVAPGNSEHVAIIAHSYGGECTVRFAEKNAEKFEKNAFAVALTDSVHIAPASGCGYIRKIARNWVCSKKRLDTALSSPQGDIERVSAGTTFHEMSSASCMDSVFQFLEARFKTIRPDRRIEA